MSYYWNCRRAKALGLQPSVPLGSDLQAAIAKAEELNRLLDAVRAPKLAEEAGPPRGTLGWMLDQIERSDEHNDRPDKTRKEIEQAFKVLRRAPMSKAQLADITGKDVGKLHKVLAEKKSLDVAARTCKWLRWVFNQAKLDKVLTGENPMDGLRIKKPPARQVYWFEEEVNAAIAKAQEMGLASIGLAIRLAFDTGQREGDILKMAWSQYDRGDIIIRQNKTSTDERNTVVRVPALPELLAALSAAPRTSPTMVISEGTRAPYKQHHFCHRVADVIKASGLVGKTFGDLRRSAVVRLAQSGCTIPEIASITGHSYARCERILEVYLPRTTPMAQAAIRKILAARLPA